VVTEGLVCLSASVTLSPTPEKLRISLAPGYDPDFGIRLPRMERTPAARHAGMRTESGATSNLGEKMKKLIGVAVLVCMTSLFGMAGEVPKPEVFGGYQFTSTDGGWHANGFSTSANFYIWKSIGITGDLGSGFSQGQSLYTYAVGPVLSHPKGNFSPYVHALFGGAHAGAAGLGVSGSTIMVGGGMDFGKHKLVFRAINLDWMRLSFNGFSDNNNVRINTGFLYRF
jgi:hypothetical protein